MNIRFIADARELEKNVNADVKFFDINAMPFVGETTIYNNNLLHKTKDNLSFAKIEFFENGKDKFFIKISNYPGKGKTHILNPYDMYHDQRDMGQYDTRSGLRYYEYIEVNKDIFDNYIVYLRTRDIRIYNGIDREVQIRMGEK